MMDWHFQEPGIGEKEQDSEILLDIFSLPGENEKPKGPDKKRIQEHAEKMLYATN